MSTSNFAAFNNGDDCDDGNDSDNCGDNDDDNNHNNDDNGDDDYDDDNGDVYLAWHISTSNFAASSAASKPSPSNGYTSLFMSS
jgi:hypothetical protein